LSGVRHGLFSLSFRPCDRCPGNRRCERFQPGQSCPVEREVFDAFVEEVMREGGSLAERLEAEDAAMCFIRLTRGYRYEGLRGLSRRTPFWEGYMTRLRRDLRLHLRDLDATRRLRHDDGLWPEDEGEAGEDTAALEQEAGGLIGLLGRIEAGGGKQDNEAPVRRPAYVRKTAGYLLQELKARTRRAP